MAIYNISSLLPGMILENDVITENGSKLFPKGIQLGERHINIMKAWGIAEVVVIESSPAGSTHDTATASSHENEKVRSEIEALFSSYDANLVMRELDRIAAKLGIGRHTGADICDFTEEWSNR